jgi:hypothetical protein
MGTHGEAHGCLEPRNVGERKGEAFYIMHEVLPADSERFVLRLLLLNCPIRSEDQLRTFEGEPQESRHEAARKWGLILDRHDEVRTAIRNTQSMNRPPSDLRFLAA